MPIQTATYRRNQSFTFRLRVPARLVPLTGRKFLKRSLRTRDPIVARLRGARLLGAARALFRELEHRGAMLRRDQVEQMIRAFYALRLEEWSHARHTNPPDGFDGDWTRTPHKARKYFDNWSFFLATGQWEAADADFRRFQELFRLDLSPESRDGLLVREHLMRAKRQLLADQIAMLENNLAAEPLDPLFKRPLPDPAEMLAARSPATAAVDRGGRAASLPLAGGPIAGGSDGEAAAIFAQAIVIAAADGRVMTIPADPEARLSLVPAVARGDLHEKALRTIPELFPEFIKRKKQRSAKTLNDYKRSLSAFVEIVGLRPVALYRPADVQEFVEVLSRVPARHRVKLDRNGPYRAAAALNEANDNKHRLPVMKAGTINNKYLTNLISFFDWAKTLEMTAKNPAAGLQIEGQKDAGTKPRRPFTIAELNAIFAAPPLKGCKSPAHFMRKGDFQLYDHRRFVPALALYTGARLNELGQLRPSDVRFEEGRWWLRITTAADPEDVEDAEEIRRLKTIAAERVVPLHCILVERFGFIAYVDHLRRAGSKRVFPHWKPSKSDGYFSSPYSKWFNERLLGTHLGIKKPEIVFHSLRHCMKDALRRARVPIEVQNRLLGHAPNSVGDTYGTPSLLPEEATLIDAISYPGLDLSHIKPFSE